MRIVRDWDIVVVEDVVSRMKKEQDLLLEEEERAVASEGCQCYPPSLTARVAVAAAGGISGKPGLSPDQE